jgi:non-heme chloroperoxidase
MTTADRSSTPGTTRRDLFTLAVSGTGIALAAAACTRVPAGLAQLTSTATLPKGSDESTTVVTKDGTNIFYKDWGKGQPIVFSHGWPLSADAWDEQLFYFGSNGFRTIAHDRRGHGRSGQPWNGNDMDTYADDLASLIGKLDLRDIILVGHSSGGGEVARYLGRHGTKRVAKTLLVSAVPPIMLKTAENPGGLPMSTFDDTRAGVSKNRSQFYKDISGPFFGANRPGSTVTQGLRDQFWLQSMQCGLRGAYDCIKAFSETDFTEDLKKIDIPALIVHGEEDQFVPVKNHAPLMAKLLPRPSLKIYPGAPHGLPMTLADRFNADLMEFIRG